MVLRANLLTFSDNWQKYDLLKIPTVWIPFRLTQFLVSMSGVYVYTPKNNYNRIEQDLQKFLYERLKESYCLKEPYNTVPPSYPITHSLLGAIAAIPIHISRIFYIHTSLI
jgi:hypothetical protein